MRPAEAVNPNVRELLREVGVALRDRAPRLVTPYIVARASRVDTFGCLDRCPIGAEGKGEDWPIPGATGKTFEELRGIRDELSRRIDTLVESRCAPARSLGKKAG